MHIPKHFNNTDTDSIRAFIRHNTFGQIVSMVDGRSFASHIPFLLSADGSKLIAHLGKSNPQWQQFGDQEILVILPGPHAYISPSWYEATGVPTWNFQAVHIYGRVTCSHDTDRLEDTVNALTKVNEGCFEQPWQPDFDKRMLNGIVGIELEIEEIQCQYKLNQNRSLAEQAHVASQLEQQGNTEIAEAMRAQSKQRAN